MFDAAPSIEVLNMLKQTVASGTSWDELAIELGNTIQFQGLYSPSLSDDVFASKYLGSMIPGYNANIAAHQSAHDEMVALLESGMPAGQVIFKLLVVLHSVSTTDPIWGAALRQWENSSEAASHYAIDKAQSSDSFATMQDVIKGVYADTASLATVIERIDQIAATGKFTLKGKVQDGYLSGATVFIDTNGDGKPNPFEVSTTTDAKGDFTLPGSDFGTIVITGGTDITTKLPFTGVMTAPAGSTVINPLTTLQQAFIAKGYSADEAEAKVGQALGIDVGNIDLTTYDPLAAALDINANGNDRAFASAVHAQATKVLNLVAAGAGLLIGAAGGPEKFSQAKAMDALYQSLVRYIEQETNGAISLSDTSVIKNVVGGSIAAADDADLTAAASNLGSMTDNFATILADSAGKIDAVIAKGEDGTLSLAKVGQIAALAQGDMTNKIQIAASNGSIESALVRSFTGAAADAAAAKIVIGDLDPNSTTDDAAIAAVNPPEDVGDTTAPTLVINSNVTAVKVGETAVITFAFSEDPGSTFAWDGSTGDVVVAGGTLGAISGSGLTRTSTFTPTAGTASGAASITVAGGLYTDPAGNTGGGGTTPAISIDTLAPTLAITSNVAAVKGGETAAITFTFSEDPSGTFAWDGSTGDIVVAGGTLGAIGGSGLTRSATFTPTAGTASGAASITVAGSLYTDAAGNIGGGATTPAISIDTLAPTLTITSNVAALKAGETAAITFTFSEDPDSTFAWDGSTGDVVLVGGTLGAISGSGLTRSATFTPTPNMASSNASITVAGSGYADAAGNSGGNGSTPAISIDTLAPTLAITSNVAALKAGETAAITFTFSEDPDSTFAWDGSTGDIVVAGGTLGAISGSGLTRTATFTPTAETASGAGSITVASGLYTDLAGNTGGNGTTPTISIDTLAPTLAITSNVAAVKAGETAAITFTFSEDPGSTFAWDGSTGDVVVAGGTLGAIGGSGLTRSATFTPTAGTASGTASITVAGSGYADPAGNTGGDGTTPAISIDTLAPTAANAAASAAAGPLINAGEEAAGVIVIATLAGTGAVAGDSINLLLGGAPFSTPLTHVLTPGEVTSGSYSFDIATGTLGANGAKSLSTVVTDVAGNVGTASPALALTLDLTAPTAASTAATAAAGPLINSAEEAAGVIVIATLTGTGAVAGDTINLLLGGAPFTTPLTHVLTAGEIDTGSYSFNIATGTLGANGAKSLTTVVTDAAGNVGAASPALALTLDLTAPTLSITSDVAALKAGETAAITFAFSEDPGSTFAWDGNTGDLVVTGGTLGAISGSGLTRSATFTPTAGTASGAASITVASGLYTDAAGNTGGGGTTPAISIDTLAPTAASAAATAAAGPLIDDAEEAAGVDVVATLAGTGAVIGDTIELLLGGTSFTVALTHILTTDEVNGGSYSFNLAAGTLGENGVKSLTTIVTDEAGNIGAASPALELTLDTTGDTFTLTAGADTGASFIGTNGTDTYVGTYNDAGTGTWNIADEIDGAGASDTLNITPLGEAAITLADTYWSGISNIEKIVINTTGAGAQTITAGANFQAAFAAAGVSLETTSTAGAISLDLGAFNGAATLAITTNAGAQTIISTGASAVTVVSTSGAGVTTITTGAGNDTITLLATAAADANVITANVGADIITLVTGAFAASETIVIGDNHSGTGTLSSADTINNFNSTIDKLQMGTAGSNTNYLEAVQFADFATASAAANSAMNSTIMYYMTSTAADGGLLFVDNNLDGTVDSLIKLTGLSDTSFAFGDIIG